MSGPVRPRISGPTTSQPAITVLGNNLEGHHVGDPPFYYNGVQGILENGSSSGTLYFVPVASGPPVPASEIFVPPDINTAWQSLMWALGSGLPDGINTARVAARGIRKVH